MRRWFHKLWRADREAEYDREVAKGNLPDHDQGCVWRNAAVTGISALRTPCNCGRREREKVGG
jgi:hypothetical protein